MRRYQTTRVLPDDLKQDMASFLDNLIADQGGVENLTTVRAGLCRSLYNLEVLVRLNMSSVVTLGVDTPSGRRAHDRLLAAVDRYVRVAQQLGIERRSKQVTSFIDAVRAANDQENQQ